MSEGRGSRRFRRWSPSQIFSRYRWTIWLEGNAFCKNFPKSTQNGVLGEESRGIVFLQGENMLPAPPFHRRPARGGTEYRACLLCGVAVSSGCPTGTPFEKGSNAVLAQLAERLLRKQQVARSRRAGSSTSLRGSEAGAQEKPKTCDSPEEGLYGSRARRTGPEAEPPPYPGRDPGGASFLQRWCSWQHGSFPSCRGGFETRALLQAARRVCREGQQERRT